MFAILPIVVALALIPAAASALLFSSFVGGNANATFGNSLFTVTPSTTQAGGHPNLAVTLNRTGTENEDIKNLIVDLPPGLIGNPEAVPSKCSNTSFSLDWCSNSQQVGTLSVNITALGFLPLDNVPGAVFVLTPGSTSAVTLGYVLRPIGSQLGVINKAYIKNEITVRTSSDYGLKNTHLNLPTQTAAVLILPVPITIQKQTLTLQSRAGSGNNGKYFMLNSSTCETRQAQMTLTSTQNVTLTRFANYTPTNCGASQLTPNPTFSTSVDNNDAGKPTGGPLNFSMSQADATIQQSTLKRVKVTFPEGTGLNTDRLAEITGCTSAQYNSVAGCPIGSKVGTASAFAHPLPPTFTGSIFALGQGGGTTIGSEIDLAIVVNGPRGITAKFRGTASVVGAGSAQRVVADFDNLPEFPLASLNTTFTEPLLVNSYNCGMNTVTTEITGHNGATVTRTAGYNIDTCPPNAIINPQPASPTSDTTPSVSFTADQVGSTFECTFDSSIVWTPCTSGQSFGPLTEERDWLFRVRACKPAGNCSQFPAEAVINIDTSGPSLDITSPTPGEDFTVDDVTAQYTTDATSVRCQVDDPVDNGDWLDCGLTSQLFADLAPGSHDLCVDAYDNATPPNKTSDCVQFDVVLDSDCTEVDPADCTPTVNITAGPRGGLKLTENSTVVYQFEADPGDTPARGFECSIDGGATYDPCATGVTYTGQPIDLYEFRVRAWGDNTRQALTTGADAIATYEIKTYEPNFTAEFLDNQNNLIENKKAAQHPDVEVTMTNDAGDPKFVQFSLPDGFWGSLGAVPVKCEQADLADGNCPAASKIGTVSLTAADDLNVERTFNADLFMVASAEDNDGDLIPENLASVGTNLNIAYDGNDYGHLREDALLSFSARYIRDNPTQANVDDPRGIDTVTNDLPNSTAVHPGPDGVATMHMRELTLHFDGETGEEDFRNLLTAPSSCDYRPAFGITEDQNANFWGVEVPYQAEDCEDVDFTPSVFQSYSPTSVGSNTTASATISAVDGQSTFRNAVIDLPYSVQPQFAGLGDKCNPANTRLIPPACDDSTMKVGTVVIDTPLLPYQLGGEAADAIPGTGVVYLETSGAPLPNLYIYIYDPVTDLDVRLRAGIKTEGTPAHLVFTMNAAANGDIRDVPDVPITNLALELPGGSNGPITLISTDCYANDNTSGSVTGWNGDVFPYSQNISFGPGCPN